MEIKDGSGLPVNAVFTVTFANITHHGVQGGVPGQKHQAQFLGSQKLLRIPVLRRGMKKFYLISISSLRQTLIKWSHEVAATEPIP